MYVDNQTTIKAKISHRIKSENVLSSEVVDVVAARKRLHIYRTLGQKNNPKKKN